jgi:large subunit ribosomal protein L23
MINNRFLKILVAPHLSEKVLIGTEKRRSYAFKVLVSSTKPQVKNAVEKLFNTEVESVRILNVKSKPRRFGKVLGKSKAWKKAYVTLKEGKEIIFATA